MKVFCNHSDNVICFGSFNLNKPIWKNIFHFFTDGVKFIKDFQQLQRYPNVEQYSPSKKGILRCDDPYDFLLDHVVRGDSSDGVPNAISDDAVFVEGRRQTRLTNKKIEELKEVGFQQEDNFMERNQKLIDLTMVPDYIEEETMRQMETEVSGDRSKILEYMMKYRLRSLIDNLEDF